MTYIDCMELVCFLFNKVGLFLICCVFYIIFYINLSSNGRNKILRNHVTWGSFYEEKNNNCILNSGDLSHSYNIFQLQMELRLYFLNQYVISVLLINLAMSFNRIVIYYELSVQNLYYQLKMSFHFLMNFISNVFFNQFLNLKI